VAADRADDPDHIDRVGPVPGSDLAALALSDRRGGVADPVPPVQGVAGVGDGSDRAGPPDRCQRALRHAQVVTSSRSFDQFRAKSTVQAATDNPPPHSARSRRTRRNCTGALTNCVKPRATLVPAKKVLALGLGVRGRRR